MEINKPINLASNNSSGEGKPAAQNLSGKEFENAMAEIKARPKPPETASDKGAAALFDHLHELQEINSSAVKF